LSGKNPDAQMKALEAANAGWKATPPAAPKPATPAMPSPMGSMPRPMAPVTGFGMDFAPASPLATATIMPVFESGDPTFRNSRND